jgi:hypothetical protein
MTNLVRMSPWIPVIVQVGLGLVTIIGSGVASGVVTHKLNARKDREEFMRTKLEALFVAIQGYIEEFAWSYSHWVDFMEGKVNYAAASESYEKDSRVVLGLYGTSVMLLNLYFPELLNEFEKLQNPKSKVSRLHLDIESAYQTKSEPARFLISFLESLVSFGDAGEELKKSIRERGRELNLTSREK